MEHKNQEQKLAVRELIYNFINDIKGRWHIVLLCAVIVAVTADVILTLTYKPQYQTTASVLFNQEVANGEDELGEVPSALGYVLSSNVYLNDLKKFLDVDEISGAYNVTGISGTSVIKITATANSPQLSYNMMYYMMKNYDDVMQYVVGDMNLRVVDEITVPDRPVNSVNHLRNLIFFGILGALLMSAYIILQCLIRDTIKTSDDVKDKLQLRLLAAIPTESKSQLIGRRVVRKKGLLVTQLSTSFRFVETFKALATRLEAQMEKGGMKTVMVNSTWEDEGKTSVAANIAITLASMGRKVLVVDTDFGKPALEKIMGTIPVHGLEEALRGEIAFEEIIEPNSRLKLDCVYVTKVISDATELLEGDALGKCLDTVRDRYDYIIIDTPPASYLGMSMIIANHVDGIVLVARQDFTPVVLINRAIEGFLGQEKPVIGCVLNRSMPRFGSRKKSY